MAVATLPAIGGPARYFAAMAFEAIAIAASLAGGHDGAIDDIVRSIDGASVVVDSGLNPVDGKAFAVGGRDFSG